MPDTAAHLLIADDDASVRRLIELVLRKDGYRLTMVADGARALEVLQSQTLDLVICDLHMPEVDGFQLLEAVKAAPALARIPIIIVTAAGQPADVEKARGLGASACLPKPFAQAPFQSLVRDLLRGRP
jgi:CheY-like chemotaxis protein